MPNPFQRIGIIGKPRANGHILATVQAVISYLIKHQYTIIIEHTTAESLPEHNFATALRHDLGNQVDLVIVVGGDGSLLNAARAVASSGTPVVGINRGSLGFLTDIHPQEFETQLSEILHGEYTEEKRFLLTAQIQHENQIKYHDDALNDVVLTPGHIAHLIEFEIYINNRFVCSQRADGLIVATPTGSTAYALSGGGPILHPQLDAIVLVPMFPHTLSSRPIVVGGSCEIKIIIATTNDMAPEVSCDGQEGVPIAPGDQLIIHKKPEQLRLIHPNSYHYFETLRDKLHWGQKSYR